MATEYRSAAEQSGNNEPGNSLDPASLDTATPEPAGKPRKPRSDAGKPRGSRTASKAKAATSSLDLSGLAGVLVGLTESIASWRDIPEIGLDPVEASELMNATQNVLRHYSIETTQKGADFIALFGTISMIIGTRIGAYSMRVRMEREGQRQNMAPNVVRMHQSPPASQQPSAPPVQAPGPTPHPEPDYGSEGGSGF